MPSSLLRLLPSLLQTTWNKPDLNYTEVPYQLYVGPDVITNATVTATDTIWDCAAACYEYAGCTLYAWCPADTTGDG